MNDNVQRSPAPDNARRDIQRQRPIRAAERMPTVQIGHDVLNESFRSIKFLQYGKGKDSTVLVRHPYVYDTFVGRFTSGFVPDITHKHSPIRNVTGCSLYFNAEL